MNILILPAWMRMMIQRDGSCDIFHWQEKRVYITGTVPVKYSQFLLKTILNSVFGVPRLAYRIPYCLKARISAVNGIYQRNRPLDIMCPIIQ